MTNMVRIDRLRWVVTTLLLSLAPVWCAWAVPIQRLATVHVVAVCDDNGANCAGTGPALDPYFGSATSKIWAQAGIGVSFVREADLHESDFLFIDDGVAGRTFDDLSGGGSLDTITMWLVRTIVGAYGEAYLGAGGMVIAMDTVMGYNAPIGRLDTIAHELGHNLGLDHDSANARYLEAPGGIRLIPGSLANICPDGACYDLLSDQQIALALTSNLLTDVVEPASVGLFAGSTALLGWFRSRRRPVPRKGYPGGTDRSES